MISSIKVNEVLHMISRKTASVIICLALVLGLGGCESMRDREGLRDREDDKVKITAVVEAFNKALKDYDNEALGKVTDWEKKEDCSWVTELMTEKYFEQFGDTEGPFLYAYCKQVASTVELSDYERWKFDKDSAAVGVNYSMVFYADVQKIEFDDTAGMISRLKEEQGKKTGFTWIRLKYKDGNWKITEADSLHGIFNFWFGGTPKLKK